MDRDFTAVEVMGVAIGKERQAQELYKRMADEIKNPLVKEKFLSLSREEQRHEEILTGMYRKMTGEGKASVPKIQFRTDNLPSSDATLEDLFQFAIEREREARKMYTQAAEIAADDSGRRTFQYLADFERGHEILLTAELQDYKKDKNWYAECPDIMLVGP